MSNILDKNGKADWEKCEDEGHQELEYQDGHEYDGDTLTITGICKDCKTEVTECWEYVGKRFIHPDGSESDDL